MSHSPLEVREIVAFLQPATDTCHALGDIRTKSITGPRETLLSMEHLQEQALLVQLERAVVRRVLGSLKLDSARLELGVGLSGQPMDLGDAKEKVRLGALDRGRGKEGAGAPRRCGVGAHLEPRVKDCR